MRNVIVKKMIPEINRLAKHNEYLFMLTQPSSPLRFERKETTSINGTPSLATKKSRFESSRFWDLGTTGAKCISRLKDNRSLFFEGSHC